MECLHIKFEAALTKPLKSQTGILVGPNLQYRPTNKTPSLGNYFSTEFNSTQGEFQVMRIVTSTQYNLCEIDLGDHKNR